MFILSFFLKSDDSFLCCIFSCCLCNNCFVNETESGYSDERKSEWIALDQITYDIFIHNTWKLRENSSMQKWTRRRWNYSCWMLNWCNHKCSSFFMILNSIVFYLFIYLMNLMKSIKLNWKGQSFGNLFFSCWTTIKQ